MNAVCDQHTPIEILSTAAEALRDPLGSAYGLAELLVAGEFDADTRGAMAAELLAELGKMGELIHHRLESPAADGGGGQRRYIDEQLRLAASIFANSQDGIVIANAQGLIVDVNPAFTRITGYSREEALGRNPRFLGAGHQRPEFFSAMWNSLSKTGCWRGAVLNRRKCGEVYGEILAISTVRGLDGGIDRYVGVLFDAAELTRHDIPLALMTNHDALTGLPNRLVFGDMLREAIARTQVAGGIMAVCRLDLDGLGAVNETYGHVVGDGALRTIARQLAGVLGPGDILARLSADDFAIVLHRLERIEECDRVLRQLQFAGSTGLAPAKTLTASIGVALYPNDGGDAETLIERAEQAMRQAQALGGNTFRLFNANHERRLHAHRVLLMELDQALFNEQLFLMYQPQVDMTNGHVLGVEALLRWRHPRRGVLAPADFLTALDNSTIETAIGEWVLGEVLAQLSAWQQAGLPLRVSCNVARSHLLQADFLERLTANLARHPKLSPQGLELEIREELAVRDGEIVRERAHACSKLGIRLALDGFGMEFSSLEHFRQIPADTLKIDQAFIREVPYGSDEQALVESAVALSAAFGRDAIAVGVESIEHGAMLIHMGCHLGQGNAIAPPMPASQVAGWLRAWRTHALWSTIGSLPISRDDVLLAAAEHNLQHWVASVSAYIRGGGMGVVSPMDSRDCHLGRWYHGQGSARYGSRPEFAQIGVRHERLHEVARELVDLLQRGGGDEAVARLTELNAAAEATVTALNELLTAVVLG